MKNAVKRRGQGYKMADLVIDPTKVCPVVFVEQGIGGFAEAILDGQIVRHDVATGYLTKANATTAIEAGAVGILISQEGSGKRGTYIRQGLVDVGDALAAMNFGAEVFLSNTDGTLGTTAGTVSVVVGTVVAGYASAPTTTADKLLRIDL
jgi:hypothetical protein